MAPWLSFGSATDVFFFCYSYSVHRANLQSVHLYRARDRRNRLNGPINQRMVPTDDGSISASVVVGESARTEEGLVPGGESVS